MEVKSSILKFILLTHQKNFFVWYTNKMLWKWNWETWENHWTQHKTAETYRNQFLYNTIHVAATSNIKYYASTLCTSDSFIKREKVRKRDNVKESEWVKRINEWELCVWKGTKPTVKHTRRRRYGKSIDTENTMNSTIRARVENIFCPKESKIVPYVAL